MSWRIKVVIATAVVPRIPHCASVILALLCTTEARRYTKPRAVTAERGGLALACSAVERPNCCPLCVVDEAR
jgi:hypothetical protein